MRKKKYIQLPRGYLSQSQYNLWKGDKKRYIEVYFNDRKEYSFGNDSMDFGKKFAESLEFERDTDEVLTDATILLLPKYDVRDKEIFAELKTNYGWLRLLAKPDTFNSQSFEFREYKTGFNPWTQAKADKHFQLRFYAVVIYLKYKKILPDAYLDWIETERLEDGTIRPTGKTKSFRVQIGLPIILQTIKEIVDVARDIELGYASHIRPPEEEF